VVSGLLTREMVAVWARMNVLIAETADLANCDPLEFRQEFLEWLKTQPISAAEGVEYCRRRLLSGDSLPWVVSE